ncbi:hypothetical protein CC1G_00950 [Coprinopsis cinerea okayama7|uniref:Uncharacterized protein n=1 Tax=Coprinopsis cinerea (strain Okayama-7 / 130 / ATCC MYA-4618 / FGSC 9003) TaxID=240176 RepID=A8N975_COPC7|nr:hypothetical protein CC1G_00950 [Coprinopsis cinerea okayama7\|eukprot:XP_001831403.2 hypothetical protein CC1G_00950 [Coprinopsis cinerea okayama7\
MSSEYKLRSVAIIGLQRLIPFARMLASIPERQRRVRHLFFSTMAQKPGEGTGKLHAVTDSVYDENRTAWIQIIQMISSTLRTCRAVSHLPRTTILLPVSCPNLVELTLQGQFPVLLYTNHTPQFPSLRSLTFSAFNDYPVYLFDDIVLQAPALEELTLLPAQPSRNLHNDLYATLDINPQSSRCSPPPDYFPTTRLPATVSRVYVQPGPEIISESRNASCLKNVQIIMKRKILHMQKHDQRNRVKFLRPGPPLVFEDALVEWLGRERL